MCSDDFTSLIGSVLPQNLHLQHPVYKLRVQSWLFRCFAHLHVKKKKSFNFCNQLNICAVMLQPPPPRWFTSHSLARILSLHLIKCVFPCWLCPTTAVCCSNSCGGAGWSLCTNANRDTRSRPNRCVRQQPTTCLTTCTGRKGRSLCEDCPRRTDDV